MPRDKVWALHDFEAENPDEVSFKAGECILVVEKDDAYGDGWWQGTNPRGETGLFPFTYTTLDESAAIQALANKGSPDPSSTPQPPPTDKGVMHNTMADIDNALTEFQGESREGSRTHDGFADSRASFTSERTADLTAEDEHSEADGGDDYASRSAAARAALAVNAQRQIESAQQREKIEEERRKAEALRQFEEEEARQRELLLEKERERQAKVAAGEIDLKKDDKPKVAPIAGIDMSDESDSEGSLDDLHDFNDKTHSPLFGNLASTPKEGTAPKENGSSLKKSIEPEPKPEPETEPEPVVSIPAAPQATVPTAETQDEKEQSEASQANGSSHAGSTLGAAAATAIAAGAGTAVVTSRSISPTPLPSRREANPSDQHSVDESSRGRVSLTDDSTAGGTGTGPGTAATSLAAAGTETPKSTAGIASVQSPPPSAAASASQPTGDPAEWTVDQVVDWARSKGWDEASVVSKFKEHEISGDVLLEMDINILKEIEIVAFGKRFQVANAIKELKKPASGALLESPAMLTSPRSEGTSSPAPPPAAALYTPPTEGALATPAARSVSGADIPSPGPRPGDSSFDQRASGSVRSRPDSYTNESAPVTGGQAFSGPSGVAAWQAHQAGQAGRPYSNQGSDAYGRHEAFGNDEPQGLLAERQFGAANRRSTVSNEDVLGALPSSPRKRESAGSGSLSKSADRTSFFGIGQRNRKPPPKVSAYGGSSQDDERPSKGTFSRLGFARSSKALSSYSDMKNNISLPTSSPSYDANGDTARRNRMSTQSGGTIGAGGNQHARQTSVGSAGPGATPNDWNASAAGVGQGVSGPQSADGPVMSRIRPVDLEGWMRKKGERYNSWKPRYLALKGSDLVILRDPQAEKIKGYVSMKGYKVIADENTNPGKYGFKILHETEKPHYFSSEDPVLVREWMKGLMKSTIGRDHSFPVISSYNNATMSLKEAQRMNPPPRPPSPSSRARTQRAKARQNPEQLTARDAAILMNLGGANPNTTSGNGLQVNEAAMMLARRSMGHTMDDLFFAIDHDLAQQRPRAQVRQQRPSTAVPSAPRRQTSLSMMSFRPLPLEDTAMRQQPHGRGMPQRPMTAVAFSDSMPHEAFRARRSMGPMVDEPEELSDFRDSPGLARQNGLLRKQRPSTALPTNSARDTTFWADVEPRPRPVSKAHRVLGEAPSYPSYGLEQVHGQGGYNG